MALNFPDNPQLHDIFQGWQWDGSVWQPAPGSGAAGTVTNVATGTGLTGGPISTSGTIALSTPVTLANGGTGLSPATNAALLTGLGAQPAGNYVTSSGVTNVATGTGLTGGPITGTGTISLASGWNPVSVANGGTGAANAATARTNLGLTTTPPYLPIAGGTLTGDLSGTTATFSGLIRAGAGGVVFQNIGGNAFGMSWDGTNRRVLFFIDGTYVGWIQLNAP